MLFPCCLSVYKYMVSVYTGKEIGAETDADVYINVYGERGDWGKRYLHKSNNTKKYRTGQVLMLISDLFLVLFLPFLTRETNFVTSCCFPVHQASSERVYF